MLYVAELSLRSLCFQLERGPGPTKVGTFLQWVWGNARVRKVKIAVACQSYRSLVTCKPVSPYSWLFCHEMSVGADADLSI
jgi:hypothetical protein